MNDDLNDEEKKQLSGWIAEKNLKGDIPYVSSKDNTSIKDLVKQTNPIPTDQNAKADLLLKGLKALYPNTGKIIKVSNQENNLSQFLCALSYSSNQEEFRYLLVDFLIEHLNYIQQKPSDEDTVNIKITPEGWGEN